METPDVKSGEVVVLEVWRPLLYSWCGVVKSDVVLEVSRPLVKSDVVLEVWRPLVKSDVVLEV